MDALEHWDMLIIGAGLSGIGAAVHLQQNCPERRFAILEARGALGGTWDLFRYPGVQIGTVAKRVGMASGLSAPSKRCGAGAAIFCIGARATFATIKGISQPSKAWLITVARWCMRSIGPRGWTMLASAWW